MGHTYGRNAALLRAHCAAKFSCHLSICRGVRRFRLSIQAISSFDAPFLCVIWNFDIDDCLAQLKLFGVSNFALRDDEVSWMKNCSDTHLRCLGQFEQPNLTLKPTATTQKACLIYIRMKSRSPTNFDGDTDNPALNISEHYPMVVIHPSQ